MTRYRNGIQRGKLAGLLVLMSMSLVGCGSSDDSSSQSCNGLLAAMTAGLSCIAESFGAEVTTGSTSGSSGSSGGPAPEPATQPQPTNTAESAALISRPIMDMEPNDGISMATVASFPTPLRSDQSVGFHVNGSIHNLADGVDTVAFTRPRTRNFVIQLCESSQGCILNSPVAKLDTAIAYFSVLDQFGTVLLSSQGDSVTGNLQEMVMDAGVLYYVMVVAEDTLDQEQTYSLRVFEEIIS